MVTDSEFPRFNLSPNAMEGLVSIDGNRGAQVFENHLSDLALLLEGSHQTLAAKLWEKNLVDDDTYDSIFDKSGSSSERERTRLMLTIIYKRLLSNDATIVMNNLLDILKEEPVWEHLLKKIESELKVAKADKSLQHPEAHALKCHTDTLATMLQSSLVSVACHARSKGLLDDREMESVVNPNAKQTQTCVSTMLGEVQEKIRSDIGQFYEFVDVLESVGPPVSLVAKAMMSEVEAII